MTARKLPPSLRGECQACHLAVGRHAPMYSCAHARCKRKGIHVCEACTVRFHPGTSRVHMSPMERLAKLVAIMAVAGLTGLGVATGVVAKLTFLPYWTPMLVGLLAALGSVVLGFGLVSHERDEGSYERLRDMPTEHEQTKSSHGRRACVECDHVLTLLPPPK